MYYEELYEKACSGDLSALKELESEADTGNAEAQYVLSCVLDNPDSPYKDISLGMYWLKKSAGYQYEPAIKKLKGLSSEAKRQYGIDDTYSHKNEEGSNTNPADIRPGGIWSFEGRIDRTTYLVYLIVFNIIFGIIRLLISQIPMEEVAEYSWKQTDFALWTGTIAGIIYIYLILALAVKRLHDCGHSGWWVILVLITIPIGPLYLLFKKGEEMVNEYGPQPE